MAEEKRPLFKKPFGPSHYDWNTEGVCCDDAICEACGEENFGIEDENSVSLSKFLGYTIVDKCCGKILDIVYQESGEQMAIRFLEEFAENPTNSEFYKLITVLKDSLEKAEGKLKETSNGVAKAKLQNDSFQKVSQAKNEAKLREGFYVSRGQETLGTVR